MQSKKIDQSEIEERKIASLPTRPTASKAFGGKGFSAREMKEAFDKLPLLLCERLNLIVDDLTRDDDDSYLASIKTGVSETHSLRELINDVTNGNLASYLIIDGLPLSDRIGAIESELADIRKAVEGGLTE